MNDNNRNNNIVTIINERIKNKQFSDKEELVSYLNNLKNNDNYKAIIMSEEQNILALYDEVSDLEKTNIINPEEIKNQNIIMQIENKIKNKQFKDKEELISYINNLKKQGVSESILNNEKIIELLNMYDELNPVEENNLNIENYNGVKLENQNLIVSKQDDVILKTNRSNQEMPQEFKENQNELSVMGSDGLANADTVFDYMRDYKKEEVNLISLSEAVKRDNIDAETLLKIKFFITNKYINPYQYKINLSNGIFYNIESQEILEVRKNEQTDQYEIYKGNEVAYSEAQNGNKQDDEQDDEQDDKFEKEKDTKEETMAYENRNVKVRRLIKPKDNNSLNNNALVKSSLLFLISIITAILIAIFLLSQK